MRSEKSKKNLLAVAAVFFLFAYLLATMAGPLQKAAPRLASLARQFTSKPALLSAPAPRSSPFSTSKANMAHDKLTLKEAVQHRRTIYQLTKKSPISDERIKEILNVAIKDVPSSFNSQSTRIIALFKDEHDKFWDGTSLYSFYFKNIPNCRLQSSRANSNPSWKDKEAIGARQPVASPCSATPTPQ